jgi:hypothetical protein
MGSVSRTAAGDCAAIILATALARGISAAVDRIDEIVAPGCTGNPVDVGWINPAITPAVLRGRGSAYG